MYCVVAIGTEYPVIKLDNRFFKEGEHGENISC